MTTVTSTDRIEKQIQLDAPRARVWHALTTVAEFGKWFGVTFDREFAVGENVRGNITSKGYEHVRFDALVETMEPESRFAFRWHPYAVDPNVDYSIEPRTLVTFTLKDVDGGTLLTVVESGFDAIPAERRAKAFEMDSKGWEGQLRNIAKHLAAA